MSVIIPKDCFHQPQVADLRLIACPGAEELTNLIDKHLVRWASEAGYQTDSFIIESACPRFQSGDAKGLVKESVRGDDIFIVVDPGNYSVTYKLFNYENHLSPDDHFANLKRLIQAVAGKAHRVSVIMPSLYGRQHRRVSRESLDCAVALQELQAMGVKNIITFDAHDPRLMNAVPLMSFDNAMPTYQVLKNLLKKNPEISFDKDKFIVVSPDGCYEPQHVLLQRAGLQSGYVLQAPRLHPRGQWPQPHRRSRVSGRFRRGQDRLRR